MKTICPKCMDDVCISVNLDDGDTLTCSSCDEEYTVAAIDELIESWKPLLAWLKAHPARVSDVAGRPVDANGVPL